MKNWVAGEVSEVGRQTMMLSIPKYTRRVESGCLEWTASCRRDGYGQIFIDGRNWSAHRAAYAALVGPIPENKCLLHSCDNPKCIEVSHLRIGTRAENTRDMVAKGRAGGAKGEAHSRAKLNNEKVREIRLMRHMTSKQVAAIYGVDEAGIRGIWTGKYWKHVK